MFFIHYEFSLGEKIYASKLHPCCLCLSVISPCLMTSPPLTDKLIQCSGDIISLDTARRGGRKHTITTVEGKPVAYSHCRRRSRPVLGPGPFAVSISLRALGRVSAPSSLNHPQTWKQSLACPQYRRLSRSSQGPVPFAVSILLWSESQQHPPSESLLLYFLLPTTDSFKRGVSGHI